MVQSDISCILDAPSQRKSYKNREVWVIFFNIPNINAFISRRTVKYVGKIVRTNDSSLPKKFLAAWIYKTRKKEHHNLPALIIQALSGNAPLKEWLPMNEKE